MSAAQPVVHDFGTDKKRIRSRAVKKVRRTRPSGTRAAPPVLVFEAAPGSPEASLPAVRIFLGTEPLQYKAERVFVYSVAKYRNPGRRYEIHFMKDLAGYDRTGWATGFTKYRFAIPQMAGGTGRAIYNDVDQIYLADPAELFDRDMGDAALLAIDQKETSVMLMDCEKLSALWQGMDIGDAKSVHEAGLWGTMPGIWNSRDTEYVAGESKLLHFTTLYKQPWQPFPLAYDYDVNENEHVWRELEAEADATGFLSYTREKPGSRYQEALNALSAKNAGAGDGGPVSALIAKHGAKTVLDYGTGKGGADHWPGVDATRHDLGNPPSDNRHDGVVSMGVLEHMPEEDIPWMLNEMFARADKFVYVDASGDTALPQDWWRGQMGVIGAMHPHVAWELNAPAQPKEGGIVGMIRSIFAPSTRFSSTDSA